MAKIQITLTEEPTALYPYHRPNTGLTVNAYNALLNSGVDQELTESGVSGVYKKASVDAGAYQVWIGGTHSSGGVRYPQFEPLIAEEISTAGLKDDSVDDNKILDGAITTAKINNLAVIATKLGAASVTASKIGLLAVGTTKLADSAVSEVKLADNAVTEDKVSALAVTTNKIGLLAVGTTKIADRAVTGDKIALTTVLTENISIDNDLDINDQLIRDVGRAVYGTDGAPSLQMLEPSLRVHNSALTFIGFVNTSTATPGSYTANNCWICSESGTVFTSLTAVAGQLIVDTGSGYLVKDLDDINTTSKVIPLQVAISFKATDTTYSITKEAILALLPDSIDSDYLNPDCDCELWIVVDAYEKTKVPSAGVSVFSDLAGSIIYLDFIRISGLTIGVDYRAVIDIRQSITT